MRKKLKIALICLLIFSLAAPLASAQNPLTEQEIWAPFDSHDSSTWIKSNGWRNGDAFFGCYWNANRIHMEDGVMELSLRSNDSRPAPYTYDCAEYMTQAFYGYGLYEVSMKPAPVSGVISSFFTYTGPSYNGAPWDEIDIEFLGNDTTKVQFNYFTNGVGNNEYYHDLGFDAADDFNTYGFDWQEDYISWYVNGELIHTATTNIPTNPQKLMMNLWNTYSSAAWVDNWAGPYTGEDANSYYEWVRFTPNSTSEPTNPIDPTPPTGVNLIKNGQFDHGLEDWWMWSEDSTTAEGSVVSDANMSGDHAFWYNISDGGDANWKIQLGQQVALQREITYTFSFEAKAVQERQLTVAIEEDEHNRYLEETVQLSSSPETYTFTFTASENNPLAQLKYFFGEESADVWIDNVHLFVEVEETSPDQNGGENGPKEPEPKQEIKSVVQLELVLDGNQAIVEDALFEQMIDQLEQNGLFRFNISHTEEASITLRLTAQQINQLREKNATLEINIEDDVAVAIPSAILEADKDFSILLEKQEQDEYSQKALSSIYSLAMRQGEQAITQFGEQQVTLTFTVDQEQINEEKKIHIFYWNADTEEWENIGGEYADGQVSAQTNHFSTFAAFEAVDGAEIVEEEGQEEEQTGKLPQTSTNLVTMLLVGVLLLAIGGFIIFQKRRKTALL